mmetsp:Transcript_43068/g.77420  ORF Transcript_43068/g.77420 Transcript_43068/m.77420 type:complete len:234 (-) Transcript_43068:686-1387(-)
MRQEGWVSCLLPTRCKQAGRCYQWWHLSLPIVGVAIALSDGIGQCFTEGSHGYEHKGYLQGYQGPRSVCYSYRCGDYNFGPEFEYYHECVDSPCWTWCDSVGADASTHPRSQHRYHHHRTSRSPRFGQGRSTPGSPRTPLLQHLGYNHLVPPALHAQGPPRGSTCTRKVYPSIPFHSSHLRCYCILHHSPPPFGIVGIVPTRQCGIHCPGSSSCHFRRICYCSLCMVVEEARG